MLQISVIVMEQKNRIGDFQKEVNRPELSTVPYGFTVFRSVTETMMVNRMERKIMDVGSRRHTFN